VGRQVGFYAVGDDQRELLRHAEEAGLRAVPEVIPADSEVEGAAPTELGGDSELFYLIPDEVGIGEAIYFSMEQEPEHDRLNAAESPVIEFSPSTAEGDSVHDGRIYLALDREDQFYRVASRAFDRLARHIRGWEKTAELGLYVGPDTAGRARRGELRLMHHEQEVRVS
jgi:hypothetical protein